LSDSPIRRLELTVTMDDGTVHEVTVGNPDMLRYDEERAKRGWPATATDAPILWQTFCAWSALTRRKQLDGMPWEAFKFAAEDVTVVKAPPVDPTPPALEVG
jgi:hypothetical protein